MKPDVVSNKSPINFKVFFLIFALLASLQAFVTFSPNMETNDSLISIISILNPSVAAFASFLVSKHYRGSKVFGRAYFALGLAFVMIILGEGTYLLYDLVLFEDPYPSPADVFFISFDILALYHLKLNIGFFNPNLKLSTKIWVGVIPAIIVLSYSFLALDAIGEFNFDFYYGIIFVIAVAIPFSFSILGAKSFRGGTLAMVWSVLVVGILMLTIGDTTYYYLELFEGYTLSHPVNLFWYGGYMIIVYALYMHRKAM